MYRTVVTAVTIISLHELLEDFSVVVVVVAVVVVAVFTIKLSPSHPTVGTSRVSRPSFCLYMGCRRAKRLSVVDSTEIMLYSYKQYQYT